MRRLILQTGISIDGYVAALDRSHPWDDGGGSAAVKQWMRPGHPHLPAAPMRRRR
jgi:hypothetical protein